jgi:uncharacterized protein
MNRLQIAKDFAQEAGRQYPQISKVILYGSVARGQDTKESDIDLIVLTKDDKRLVDKGINSLMADYIIETSEVPVPFVYSEDEYSHKDNPFTREIAKDGRILFSRN